MDNEMIHRLGIHHLYYTLCTFHFQQCERLKSTTFTLCNHQGGTYRGAYFHILSLGREFYRQANKNWINSRKSGHQIRF